MLRRLALVDIDGVIADDRHRVHHALARDWGAYFAKMDRDGVWSQGRTLIDNVILAGFDDLAYCTGRRQDTEEVTRRWLKRHRFEKAPVLMRHLHDRRPLAEVKAETVLSCLGLFDEVWMFDDDPTVIDAVARVDGGVGYHCTWYTKETRLIRRGRT